MPVLPILPICFQSSSLALLACVLAAPPSALAVRGDARCRDNPSNMLHTAHTSLQLPKKQTMALTFTSKWPQQSACFKRWVHFVIRKEVQVATMNTWTCERVLVLIWRWGPLNSPDPCSSETCSLLLCCSPVVPSSSSQQQHAHTAHRDHRDHTTFTAALWEFSPS